MIALLSELHIENFAVIENATIRLGGLLNVFTGETGAGKSILIGGINAVLGHRVYKDIIRDGAKEAYVSAVFTDISGAAAQKLSEMGFDNCDELIISRTISTDGKSTARINSRPVSVSSLREIGDLLVNIHGQHDSRLLLDPSEHLGLLDSFAESQELLSDYRNTFKKLQYTARQINQIKQNSKNNARRIEYLTGIINEIGGLEISEDEDASVDERFKLLDNAVSLSEAISAAVSAVSGNDSSGGASELVAGAYSELELNEDIMPDMKQICERLSSVEIELRDISDELSRLLGSLDIDESEYAMLTQRKNDLQRIKRRYGPNLSDVLKLYQNSMEELSDMTASDDRLELLEKDKSSLLSLTTKKAEALSDFRKKASERFVAQISKELEFLNMPDVRFEVMIQKGKLTSSGMDSLELLISANRGEAPKPLAKIASGGELSRIMLALKTVMADKDSVPTLIFDEIDAGVSGRAAQKIGIKLRQISRKRQVICVTHLAQIAIMADNHLLIEKQDKEGRASTEITPLDFESRKYEIARILGGDNITETVLKDAEEQLESVMKG